jgi:hypothetical protein
MNVYKISEINEEKIKNQIKFSEPCLKINHYFIDCETNIFLQLDNIYFKENFKKKESTITSTIYVNEQYEKKFLIFDNLIIKTTHELFPLWFNKEIDMTDLLEYYVPTIKDYYENNENNDITSDIFSYTSSESSEDNKVLEAGSNIENTNDIELIIECNIPYNYEDNDLDIMIFDSSNNMIEELWNNIDVMGKKGTCVLKLSGLKIEKNKFCSVWELIQLKIF